MVSSIQTGKLLRDHDDSPSVRRARVVAECSDLLNAGETVDVERIRARHSDLGPELTEALKGLLNLPSHEESEPPFERIGDYRLLREVGRGNMGVVYEAWQESMERRVAVKVLPADLVGDERAEARFLRGARLASQLDHPGICTTFGAGLEKRVPFVVMRYIEGETLATKVSRAKVSESTYVPLWSDKCRGDISSQGLGAPKSSGKSHPDLPPFASGTGQTRQTTRGDMMAILHLIERVARALHVAHVKRIVHRDIKPSNIMVTWEGDPVLLDFGLARGENHDVTGITGAWEVLGTPHYMAPEQIAGPRRDGGGVDHRADIYSLGITLYQCVTLRLPFFGETTEGLFRKIRYSDPPNPRHINRAVPKELKIVLEAALEKDPNRRYQTALAFAEDLRRIRNYEPIKARVTSRVLRLRRWSQRNPVALTVMACLLVFLATTSGLYLWAKEGWKRSREAEKTAQREAESERRRFEAAIENKEYFSSEERGRWAGRTGPAPHPGPPLRLTFAVYTSDEAAVMYRQFDPILAYLERSVSRGIGRPLLIDFQIFRSYDRAGAALVDRKVDFVRFGPTSYILAKRENPNLSLLAIEEEDRTGNRLFYGMIFTYKRSGIKTMEDVRGKSFAFVDPNSTIGSHLAKGCLVDHGIYEEDLGDIEYLGSHDKVCEAVAERKYAVGAAKEGTFNKFKEGLEVIHRVVNVTKPWVAREGLESERPEVFEAIKKSLFALKDRQVLSKVGKRLTGFGKVEDADGQYRPVLEAMEKAKRFERAASPHPQTGDRERLEEPEQESAAAAERPWRQGEVTPTGLGGPSRSSRRVKIILSAISARMAPVDSEFGVSASF